MPTCFVRGVLARPLIQLGVVCPSIHTSANNLQAVSVGWAPTPTQYFARITSSWMSLCSLPEVS